MPRYPELRTEPAKPAIEGDPGFMGLNMELEATALEPGQYADARNNRCHRGVLQPRGGMLTPVFANMHDFGTVLNDGTFNNPNGEKVRLLATPDNVRVIQEGRPPRIIPIPAGVTLSGRPEFSQQFEKVLLHRGKDTSVNTTTNTSAPAAARKTLVWDGVSDEGFVLITKSSELTERALLPNADWGINFGSRAIIAVGKDRIVASDVDDYSIADLILHTYRVNAGTADPITGLYGMTNAQLLVGKAESIDVLNNFVGDLSQVSARIVSDRIGISARKTGLLIGDNLVFLHRTGFFRTQRTQDTDGRLYVPPVPLFATANEAGKIVDPIGPLIRRINWAPGVGLQACGVALEPRVYFAVPLDESRRNNCILVGNILSGQWEGYDTWDAASGVQIDSLFTMEYLGQPAVWALNRARKSVHVLYQGNGEDETSYDRVTGLHTSFPISHMVQTRAYLTSASDGKTLREYKNLVIKCATWRPKITVAQLVDGTGDERVLTPNPITRNRRKYYRAFMSAYDLTNVHNDFGAPSREDYSIVPPSEGYFTPGDEIVPLRKANKPLEFAIRARGQHVAYRIENTQGECDILSTLLETVGGGREIKRAA